MAISISPGAIPFIEDIYGLSLISAILKVDDIYRIDDTLGQVGELVFAYELYHQWRKELEVINPDRLTIYGEPKKIVGESKWEKRPDLVLHKRDDNSSNRIACEIKISNNNIKADFSKLKDMISDIQPESDKLHAFGYKWGVFLYTFRNDISGILRSADEFNDIILINSPSKNELKIITAKELIANI